jgi:tetratricopeptide (TPR) repeat protein
MQMIKFSRVAVPAALLAMGLVSAAYSPVAFAQACPEKVSGNKTGKPLKAAGDAVAAKQWATVLSKSAEAAAIPGRNAYDDYLINRFQSVAYASTGRNPEAIRELEAVMNSPCGAAERGSIARAILDLQFRAKNWDKAIDAGNRVLKGGWAGADTQFIIGQAIYFKGDYAGSAKFFKDYVGDLEKRSQTPSENILKFLADSCIRVEDAACMTQTYERLVQSYPKPDYWYNLILALRRDGRTEDNQELAILRLALGVDALRNPGDYQELAQLALERGLPGEAVAVLETAFAKDIFKDPRDKDRNNRLLTSAKTRAATDRASLAKQDVEAAASKNGDASVNIGAAFLSYGDAAKAVTAITRGIAKGNVKNPDEANLLLGMAHMRAGNKAEAAKAFKAVKTDAKLTRVAKLWLLST